MRGRQRPPEDGVGSVLLVNPNDVTGVELLPRGVLDVLADDEGVGADPQVVEVVGVSPVLALP